MRDSNVDVDDDNDDSDSDAKVNKQCHWCKLVSSDTWFSFCPNTKYNDVYFRYHS